MDWRKSSSLGLRLIHLLAGQLSAGVELAVPPDGGTEFSVSFQP
jgi:two-component sensor histidine kinase